MQPTIRTLSLLTGILVSTFLLLRPSPAYADAPICSLPDISIPGGSGTYDRPTQTPFPVPGPVVTDTITVADSTLISDLNLVISITHSYVGDLTVTLTHTNAASQTAATVINMPLLGQSAYPATEPACSGDNIRLTLDDEGLFDIQTDCAEEPHPAWRNSAFISGEHYTPFSPLNVFDGEVVSGTWEIAITDNFSGDWGTLNGWCLVPNSASQDLNIFKRVDGSMYPGDPLTYTIKFGNLGYTPVTGVVLTDIIPTELTGVNLSHSGTTITDTGASPGYVWDVEPLAEGESGIITITGLLSSTLPGGTSFSNIARISGTGDTDLDNNLSEATATTPTPDLQISKVDNGGLNPISGRITYTLSYSNAGGQATGVQLIEILPDGTSFNAAGSPGWQQVGTTAEYTYSVGAMQPDDSGSATFVVDVNDPLPAGTSDIINNAYIYDDGQNGNDQNQADNSAQTVTTAPKPDLTLTKQVNPTITAPGQPVTYTITLANNGQATAIGVTITDIVPADITGLSVTSSGVAITNTGAVPAYVWAAANLAPSQTGVITLTGTLTDTPGTTPIDNTATITTASIESDSQNNTDTASLTVGWPDLIISQTDSADAAPRGQPLTYTITITNQGTYTATGLVVTNTLPGGVNFNASVPGAPTCTEAGGIVTCSLPNSLGPNEHTSLTLNVTPTLTGTLMNTVTVAAAEPESDTTNNEAVETTTVNQAAIIVTESGGSTNLLEGSLTDTYTIKLTTQPAHNVVVSLTDDNQVDVSTPTLTFTPVNWSNTQTVTVTATDDGLYEGTHTGLISHTVTSSDSIYNGLAVPGITATILDDEQPPTVQFTTAAASGSESAGSTFLQLSLSPNASALAVTVDYAVGGTATSGADYTLSSGPATIGAGQTSATLTLTVSNDSFNEPDETVIVTLTNPVNAGLGTPISHTYTILDNDPAPDTTPPAAPSLITPTNSITLTTARPVFRWNPAADSGGSGVVSYTLTLTHSGVVSLYSASQTSFTPTVDLPDGSYRWTVRAHDGAGNTGPAAPVTNFTINTAAGGPSQYKVFLPLVIK